MLKLSDTYITLPILSDEDSNSSQLDGVRKIHSHGESQPYQFSTTLLNEKRIHNLFELSLSNQITSQ